MAEGQLKLKNNPDSSELSEAIKEYDIPARHEIDGVRVPLSPVVMVDPLGGGLVPQTWWAWTYRVVGTQDNVAGGALRIDFIPQPGQLMRLGFGSMAASGTRGLICGVRDATNNIICYTAIVGASAAATAVWPVAASAANTTAGQPYADRLLLNEDVYYYAQVTAAAQTETATFAGVFYVSTPERPTITWANSTGTPNPAAATIDRLTKVRVPW